MHKPTLLLSTGQFPGGLSPRQGAARLYGECVVLAGGQPIQYAGGDPAVLAQLSDGLLLTGGVDVAPERYGASRLPTDEVDESRDTEEWSLITAFLKAGKPILGICRGIQVLNVYYGGTLQQDIAAHNFACHTVTLSDDSLLSQQFGSTIHVNSYHHQAVDNVAPDFLATAFAEDGTVEAIAHKALPVWGVQWHPERMVQGFCYDCDCDQLPLFSNFVQECEKS